MTTTMFDPHPTARAVRPLGLTGLAVGMLVAGLLLLSGRRWAGPGRFTALLCGLYPFVVLMPVVVIVGDGNKPAIVGFGAVWALFDAFASAQKTLHANPASTRRSRCSNWTARCGSSPGT